jgi:hypothetical protein
MKINTEILSMEDVREKMVKRHKWIYPIECAFPIFLMAITIITALGFIFILIINLFPWENVQNQWLMLGLLVGIVIIYAILLKVEFNVLKCVKKRFEEELAHPKIWGYPRVMISKNTEILIPTNYNVKLEGSKFTLYKLGQNKEQIAIDEPMSIFIIGEIYKSEDSEFWIQLETQDTEVTISSLKYFPIKGEKYRIIREKSTIGFN